MLTRKFKCIGLIELSNDELKLVGGNNLGKMGPDLEAYKAFSYATGVIGAGISDAWDWVKGFCSGLFM